MTQLLVSVRNAAEAAEALRGGADWIDLKEPAHGALGPVFESTASDVVKIVAGRSPVSAACGELLEWKDERRPPSCLVPGVCIAKVGLAGCRHTSWQMHWLAIREHLERLRRQLVAVVYVDDAAADAPRADEVIATAARFGGFVLFDTYDKSAGSILELCSNDHLAAVLQSTRVAGLKNVVAGRISAGDVSQLPLQLIDVIGVRGAACEGGRNGAVSATRVRTLRRAIEASRQTPIESGVFPGPGSIA